MLQRAGFSGEGAIAHNAGVSRTQGLLQQPNYLLKFIKKGNEVRNDRLENFIS